MRNKTQTRVLSLVLALVMLLPLISIPTFAEGEVAGPTSLKVDFEGATELFDAVVDSSTTSHSAQIVEATKDAAAHGNVLRMDAAPAKLDGILLWKKDAWANGLYKFELTPEEEAAALAAGVISGTAKRYNKYSALDEVTVENAPINKDAFNNANGYNALQSVVVDGTTYVVLTGDAYSSADAHMGAIGGNVSASTAIKHGAIAGDSAYLELNFDLYLSPDFVTTNGLQGRMQSTSGGKWFELFKITRATGAAKAKIEYRDNGVEVGGLKNYKMIAVDAWNTITIVINRQTGVNTLYVNGDFVFQCTNKDLDSLLSGKTATLPLNYNANTLQFEFGRDKGDRTSREGYVQIDNASFEIHNRNFDIAQSFDGAALNDFSRFQMPGAVVVAASANGDGDALQIPMRGTDPDFTADYYVMKKNDNNWKNLKSIALDESAFIEDNGTISGTDVEGYYEFTEAVINDSGFVSPIEEGSEYYVVTPELASTYCGGNGGSGDAWNDYNRPLTFRAPAANMNGQFWTASFDLYVSPDFKNDVGVTGRVKVDGLANTSWGSNGKLGAIGNGELFKLYTKDDKVYISYHPNANLNQNGNGSDGINQYGRDDGERELQRDAWYRIDIIIERNTTEQFLFVDGEFAFRAISVDRTPNNGLKYSEKPTEYSAAVTYKAMADVTMGNGHAITPTVATPVVVRTNELQIERMRNVLPGQLGGYMQIDNLNVSVGDQTPEGLFLDYDFEGVVTHNSNLDVYHAGFARTNASKTEWLKPTVVDIYGSKVYKRGVSSGGLTADYSWYLPLPTLSYKNDSVKNFVYELDYFVDADAKGRVQVQLQQISGENSNGVRENKTWLDLYRLEFLGADGCVTLNFESKLNSKYSERFETGRWHTVSCAMDLVNGLYDIYVDGHLIFADLQTGYKNIEVAPDAITVGKTNAVKVNNVVQSGKGYFYMDNVRLVPGDKATVAPANRNEQSFDETFKYSVGKRVGAAHLPTLAKLETVSGSNLALRVEVRPDVDPSAYSTYVLLNKTDGGRTRLEGFSCPDGDPANATLNGEPIELTYDPNDGHYQYAYTYKATVKVDGVDKEVDKTDIYCLTTEAAATASIGDDGHTTQPFKTAHDQFSYATHERMMLEADFFIEEGSRGVLESQFENYFYGEEKTAGTWLNLYTINLATGRVNNGLCMNVGEWNNLKVIIDLKTGDADIYVNDVYSHTNATKANLTVGGDYAHSWAIAKIMRQIRHDAVPNEGAYLLDNTRVTAEVATSNSETFGDKFLSDDAFFAFANNTLMEGVDGASIRMKDPSGLRFATRVNWDSLDEMIGARLPEGTTVEIGKKGTLIAPESYYNRVGEFTHAAFDEALKELVPEGKRYLDIGFGGLYFAGAEAAGLPEGDYMVGSIVNIKDISRSFAAVGYTELIVDGVSYMLYTDVTVRCAKDVAQSWYDDYKAGIVDLTSDEVQILEDTFQAA